ncbi:hypothetical protein [Phenylobacterium sp.]|uniref:hypothetical protein n=1 Tax=Phenylobacterium sp. TaxID=1871053 RepID=UPI0025DBA337|nr:hypothetical protein [Phenylobacterium sp.]
MAISSHLPSSYAALRYGGASSDRAQAELRIGPGHASKLEAIFRVARPGKAQDRIRPRFARHDLHVDAVCAAGGYPVLRL